MAPRNQKPEAQATTTDRAPMITFSQLPQWAQQNPQIHQGYRPITPKYTFCLTSLTYLHNETGNIFSHLLPIFPLLYQITHSTLVYFQLIPSQTQPRPEDVVVFSAFFAGWLACMVLSSTYHTLMCHSKGVAMRCKQLDYTGITCLIYGSFVPTIYYLFTCEAEQMRFYLTIVSRLLPLFTPLTDLRTALSVPPPPLPPPPLPPPPLNPNSAPTKPNRLRANSPQIQFTTIAAILITFFLSPLANNPSAAPLIAPLFMAFASSAFTPIYVGYQLYGYSHLDQMVGLKYVLTQGLIYIIGVSFFIVSLSPPKTKTPPESTPLPWGFPTPTSPPKRSSQPDYSLYKPCPPQTEMPERLFPGRVDYFFSSHQLFHIAVVIAATVQFIGLQKAYGFQHEHYQMAICPMLSVWRSQALFVN